MKHVVINSLADLIAFQRDLDTSKAYCFRGQSDASWGLIPSIYRPLIGATPEISGEDGQDIGQRERDLYREFERLARNHMKLDSAWERVCVAQHFGCSTRLLDWTRNALVAAYFALLGPSSNKASSAVWCLALTSYPFPSELGRQTPKGGFRLANVDQYCGGFTPSFMQAVSKPLSEIASMMGASAPATTLVVFEVPSVEPRIESQSCLFSTHLSFADEELILDHFKLISDAEEDKHVDYITKLEIPHGVAASLRIELERAGVSIYRLFPDLVGLGWHLKDENSRALRDYLVNRTR